MAKVMTSDKFVEKAKDIVKNYETLYVLGSFGSPLTSANKKRFINQNAYNKKASRKKKINAASSDTFAFDCSGLIKGILWGWNGNKKKSNGGATYGSNSVKDINANTMMTANYCSGISTNFKKIEVGEILWTTGHVGIYIGNGLAIESTPSWKDGVQITAVKNIGSKTGYKARTWKKHGKLKYIEYVEVKVEVEDTSSKKTYFKKYTGKSSSLVDALKSIGANSTFSYRTKIARSNGMKLYIGSSKQNATLLEKLKAGKLIKP